MHRCIGTMIHLYKLSHNEIHTHTHTADTLFWPSFDETNDWTNINRLKNYRTLTYFQALSNIVFICTRCAGKQVAEREGYNSLRYIFYIYMHTYISWCCNSCIFEYNDVENFWKKYGIMVLCFMIERAAASQYWGQTSYISQYRDLSTNYKNVGQVAMKMFNNVAFATSQWPRCKVVWYTYIHMYIVNFTCSR